MPTAPTTLEDAFGLVGDFFLGFWLGQTITGTAVIAILAWAFKPLRRRLQTMVRWAVGRVKDVELTRKSTTQLRIKDAVDSAIAAVRAELTPPADPWSAPTALTDEDRQAARFEANHRANMRDQWSLSTNRTRKHGFVLHNHAARTAQRVRLDGARGFEFLDGAEWDEIEQGEAGRFDGRVVDAQTWNLVDRKMDVHWIDDHGDAQIKRIQVDRTLSSVD